MVKNGCGQSGHGILKLTASKKWVNDFLHAGANSWKLKVDSVNFGPWSFSLWNPKSAHLKNEFMNWADFLNTDSDVIIFGLTNILLFHF